MKPPEHTKGLISGIMKRVSSFSKSLGGTKTGVKKTESVKHPKEKVDSGEPLAESITTKVQVGG